MDGASRSCGDRLRDRALDAGYSEIAVGGFHSKFGWLFFCASEFTKVPYDQWHRLGRPLVALVTMRRIPRDAINGGPGGYAGWPGIDHDSQQRRRRAF